MTRQFGVYRLSDLEFSFSLVGFLLLFSNFKKMRESEAFPGEGAEYSINVFASWRKVDSGPGKLFLGRIDFSAEDGKMEAVLKYFFPPQLWRREDFNRFFIRALVGFIKENRDDLEIEKKEALWRFVKILKKPFV